MSRFFMVHCVVRHTRTILLSEQLDDVDDKDDDSSETCNVEVVMGSTVTINKLHLRPNVRNTWPSSARLLSAVY